LNLAELFQGWITEYEYAALFALLMLGIVGLPVPDETLLVFAGYLVFKQQLTFAPAALAAFLGSACGITLSYWIGRTLSGWLASWLERRLGLSGQRFEAVRQWYQRKGKYALVAGYFLPGIRHLTAFVAGSSRLPFPVFAGYAFTGGLLWSLTFLALGYGLGDEWARLSDRIHRLLLAAAAVALTGLAGYLLTQRRRGWAAKSLSLL
jgi:membrane protein DedA with SNARE-associated domain